jgi:hypothetical protein
MIIILKVRNLPNATAEQMTDADRKAERIPFHVAPGSIEIVFQAIVDPSRATFHAPPETGATATSRESGSGRSWKDRRAARRNGTSMSHAELREPRLHRITASPLEPCNSSLEEVADAP